MKKKKLFPRFVSIWNKNASHVPQKRNYQYSPTFKQAPKG